MGSTVSGVTSSPPEPQVWKGIPDVSSPSIVREVILEYLDEGSLPVQVSTGKSDRRVFTSLVDMLHVFLLGGEGRFLFKGLARSDGEQFLSRGHVIGEKCLNGVVIDPSGFGPVTRRHQSAVRAVCREIGVPYIAAPFEVLDDLGVETSRICILEQGCGRSVFYQDGRCFYRGNGSREWRRGSGFVVELPGYAETVEQALELILPREVLEAEAEGLEVVRQGEWFFVPVEGVPVGERHPRERGPDPHLGNHVPEDKVVHRHRELEPLVYVRGVVSHLNEDHPSLDLGGTWHLAVTHGLHSISFDTAFKGRYAYD